MVKQTRVSNANMMTFPEKLGRFSWGLFVPMCMVLTISIMVLYSAGGGNWRPFALSQLMKIILGFGVFFFAAFTNIKTWIKSAYLIYAIALIMIVLVTFVGHTGMGAQRWLNLGIIHIQPSELIKIALVLALARYFAWFNSVELGQFKNYLAPGLMLLVPFGLIVAQPDLGTALSLGMITVGVFYIVGANKKWFIIAAVLGLMAAPAVWFGGLHDYQRGRIIKQRPARRRLSNKSGKNCIWQWRNAGAGIYEGFTIPAIFPAGKADRFYIYYAGRRIRFYWCIWSAGNIHLDCRFIILGRKKMS